MKTTPFGGALLASLLLLAPLAEAAESIAPNLGAESPEALVERLRASALTEDFGELAACLSPAAREEMAKGIWAGATMMIAMSASMGEMVSGLGEEMGEQSEEAKAEAAKAKAEAQAKFGAWAKRYDEIAKKHGLPALSDTEKLEGSPDTLFAKADLVALIADFGGLLQGFGEEQGGKREKKPIEGQLEGLKIDGDRAAGTLAGDPIQFVKIEGRWYIAELPQGDAPAEN